MSANQKSSSLAGITAGETSICTVGKEGVGTNAERIHPTDFMKEPSFGEENR